MSNYAGIDYGLGQSNINKETGIHYGVISQHTPSPEAVDDVYHGPHSRDLAYENWVEHVKKAVSSAVLEAVDHLMLSSRAEELAKHLSEEAEGWDWLGDSYNGDEADPLYEHDGYKIVKCLDYDLFVLKSPYYTHAQYCSPCVPGAGNLDHPCKEGPKSYCLGHDWFEDGKAPYDVFDVISGAKVPAPFTSKDLCKWEASATKVMAAIYPTFVDDGIDI
jgi:hypothetical protein